MGWWRRAVLVVPVACFLYYLKDLRDPRALFLLVVKMYMDPDNIQLQVEGCHAFAHHGFSEATAAVMDVGHKKQQLMGKAGAPAVVLRALRRHPKNREVVKACGSAVGGLSLWSRPNGLWLGKNGALELLVQSFATFENDTEMLQFGLLGCLFDKVAENRIKFGQQGGVSYLLSMLKQDKFYYNNNVNLQVWYAFSAGCYDNAVRFRDAGGIELGVRSMADFPAANRIREEVLQAFKGVSVHSQEMRELVAQAGAGEQYVKAIRENVSDPQLVSLCSENMAKPPTEQAPHRG